jgi:hypothetical protein
VIQDCAGREHAFHDVDTTTYDDLARGYRTALRVCDRCGAVDDLPVRRESVFQPPRP